MAEVWAARFSGKQSSRPAVVTSTMAGEWSGAAEKVRGGRKSLDTELFH